MLNLCKNAQVSDRLIIDTYCSDVLANLDCLNRVALQIQLPPYSENMGNVTQVGFTVEI